MLLLVHFVKYCKAQKLDRKPQRDNLKVIRNKVLGDVIGEDTGCLDPSSFMPCTIIITSIIKEAKGHVGYSKKRRHMYPQEDEYVKEVFA